MYLTIIILSYYLVLLYLIFDKFLFWEFPLSYIAIENSNVIVSPVDFLFIFYIKSINV
jgi:hypothetical protein